LLRTLGASKGFAEQALYTLSLFFYKTFRRGAEYMCKYYVYVLKSLKDNFHYIGHTKDIQKRLKSHNYKKVRSTKSHAPYKVIYSECFSTKSIAAKREYYLKQARGNILLRQYLSDIGVW
jgi:putative endonuclease